MICTAYLMVRLFVVFDTSEIKSLSLCVLWFLCSQVAPTQLSVRESRGRTGLKNKTKQEFNCSQ